MKKKHRHNQISALLLILGLLLSRGYGNAQRGASSIGNDWPPIEYPTPAIGDPDDGIGVVEEGIGDPEDYCQAPLQAASPLMQLPGYKDRAVQETKRQTNKDSGRIGQAIRLGRVRPEKQAPPPCHYVFMDRSEGFASLAGLSRPFR